MTGRYQNRPNRARTLPYPTMTLDAIKALPVGDYAAPDAHLWLWTTNAYLDASFDVLRAWGFKYLTTVTWVKPNGLGNWFAATTQHCLFGYRHKCVFPGRRYAPTHFHAAPKRHSAKPEQFYQLVEEVSAPARLELFARRHRLGYDVWGNEVESDIVMAAD
jgi:N6-adenosine-specific RNA methylase IME4